MQSIIFIGKDYVGFKTNNVENAVLDSIFRIFSPHSITILKFIGGYVWSNVLDAIS